MKKVRVLVLSGYGINCEVETAYVYKLCGAAPDIVHLSEIFAGEVRITDYHVLTFPGGFLDGDHLGAAQACAHRFRFLKVKGTYYLWDDLQKFLENGGLILGICNGFQLLMKMGLLPGGKLLGHRVATLTYNDSGRFEDRWAYLKVAENTPCVFLKGLKELYLPVRHGEGKFLTTEESILYELEQNGQLALKYIHPETREPTLEYPFNPNGSPLGVAGVCDPTGRIFGLMPHPEAFNHYTNHPRWTAVKRKTASCLELSLGEGIFIFQNAVDWARDNLL